MCIDIYEHQFKRKLSWRTWVVADKSLSSFLKFVYNTVYRKDSNSALVPQIFFKMCRKWFRLYTCLAQGVTKFWYLTTIYLLYTTITTIYISNQTIEINVEYEIWLSWRITRITVKYNRYSIRKKPKHEDMWEIYDWVWLSSIIACS